LGKGIEEVFLKYVISQTKYTELIANYIKTAKNSLVESFYDKMGFELFAEDGVIKQYRIILINADLTFKQLYTIN
jgi:predicted enzyme involved in methoxymalonyl-ACP biosynthesis